MNCPDTETLHRWTLGFLEDEAPVEKHVKACAACGARANGLRLENGVIRRAARTIPRRGARRIFSMAAAGVLVALVAAMVFWPRPHLQPASPLAPEDQWPDVQATFQSKSSKLDPAVIGLTDSDDSVQVRALEVELKGPTTYYDAGGKKRSFRLTVEKTPKDMTFEGHGTNAVIDTSKETTSTFGLDVDTASYTMTRDYLRRGLLPPKEAVRVEEFLNYFRYHDDAPPTGTFAIHLEAAPSPFTAERHLLRIAVAAKEIKDSERKDVVLTFVIDVSGSMAQENRLELVKKSLRHLVERLRPTDRVGIVVYGSNGRKLLDPTPVAHRDQIVGIIDELRTEGCTNLEEGLNIGYDLASKFFDAKANNRVIICTDGVANNGITDARLLVEGVKDKAAKGIYLSVLGFGMGNHNDALLEKLADTGNGHHAYIDGLAEAKKIFSENLVGMLEVVAADAKLQVEFDPATVASFRQIGYEKRRLDNQDFRNDKVDAGEVGAGHHVTALYEIALKPEAKGRLATVRLRYREPGTKEVPEAQASIGVAQVKARLSDASPSFRLAAAVAAFAEVLRESDAAKNITLDQVLESAHPAVEALDQPADAVEFLALVKTALTLRKK